MSIRTFHGRAGALVSAALGALCLQVLAANSASAQCVGDCDGDGMTAINELITGVNIALGSQPVSACPEFANASNEVDIAQLIKGVNNALEGCPVAPTATATETATEAPTVAATATATETATETPIGTTAATATPTVTPVPGTPIGMRQCTLVGAADASRVKLNAGTLPLPPFPMSGTMKLTLGSVSDGKAPATCDVVSLDPINIPGIGYVCISAADEPCAEGVVDCDGGRVLGVEIKAEANIGSCDGNGACAAQCQTYCGNLGYTVADPFGGCTAYCRDGTRNGLSCNCDTTIPGRCSGEDCPGGSCNGPDNALANPDICQCQCIDRAAGEAQRPGEMTCNLPAKLVVERGAPCGDGDVLINVGTACAPLTTGVASSIINDANYIPGNIIPAGPCQNAEGMPQTPTRLCTQASDCLNPAFPVCGAGPAMAAGAPVSCEQLQTSTSGLKLRGMLNFFGSTLGDLVSELYVDCQ